jgi:hypothetical protein
MKQRFARTALQDVDRWPRTAQGKLDRARLVWMADFADGREI